MTQHDFYPSPNWMETSDKTILSSSNPSLKLFMEFNEGDIPKSGAVPFETCQGVSGKHFSDSQLFSQHGSEWTLLSKTRFIPRTIA